jgi:hypothetical protein
MSLPEFNGYRPMDYVAQRVGVGNRMIWAAIEEFGIELTTCKLAQRFTYYSPADIQRVKYGLLGH